jgi:rfaE bifunctional protein nucleotidyltransferase chain/domain
LGHAVSQDHLILQRRQWKDNGQCIVFVSGRFDLLHPGHIRLLEQARSHGDILIVGVQSDASVRRELVGDGASRESAGSTARPITPGAERAEILASLAAVDYVVEFVETTAAELADRLMPDIIVEGASSQSNPSEKSKGRAEESQKCKRVTILLEPGFSTTRLIERITQARA